MASGDKIEKLLWSVALPGFGQLLNKRYVKGVILIALEIIINSESHLNSVIQSSFHGNIAEAIAETNYQWLMFYPCVYMFAIWDAYRDADEEKLPFTFVPFVSAAFFSTVGLIYSPTAQILGFKLGPVWLTMLFCFIGIFVGLIFKKKLI
jgi:hypothetical protein